MEKPEKCVKSVQSPEVFSFSPITFFVKNPQVRCSTGFSIHKPLKLMIEIPEQPHTCHFCVFIADFEHISQIGFHAYFLYFTHKFMFLFFWTSKYLEGFQKSKWIDDVTHFFSSFWVENVFI